MHTHKALKHVGQVSQVKDVVELQSCGHEDLESNIKSFVLLSVLQMKLKYLIEHCLKNYCLRWIQLAMKM